MNTSYIDTVFGEKYHWQLIRLSWGAVIAGCVVALSVHLLLALLAISLGVRMVNPFTDPNPVEGFTAAVGIGWSVGALISLWIGGWVAGRTCGRGFGNIGGLHGVVVWSVATVVSAFLVSAGTGLLAGGAANIVSDVAGGAAKGLASNPSATSSTFSGMANSAQQLLSSFLDEAMTENNTPGNTTPAGNGTATTIANAENSQTPNSSGASAQANAYNNTNGSPGAVVGQNGGNSTAQPLNAARARREVGVALFHDYSDRTEANKAALTQALVDYTGQTRAQAEATVAQWDRSFNRMEADAKAAADTARKNLVILASWTFLAFAIGAFAAAWGGFCGARRASKFYVSEAPASVRVPPTQVVD